MATATMQERVDSLEREIANLRMSDRRDLRDYFAGHALGALVLAINTHGKSAADDPEVKQRGGLSSVVAQAAFDYADAMIAERAK